MHTPNPSPHIRSHALSLLCLVASMVMLSYASVPLYRMFCQVTGFGGTTQRASSASSQVTDQSITVRFNADTDPALPWKFAPVERSVDIKIGANTLIAYTAENTSDETITGMATYNVTPHELGRYFDKVQCFCFEEQTLAPRQKVNMPVSFYIDPEILNDPDARNIKEVTLSYTFFPRAAGARLTK